MFISTVVSGLCMPLLILLLNNGQTRKLKELEADIDLRKREKHQTLERQDREESQYLEYEATFHACLVKILFSVQQLHVELSGTCIDEKCIEDGTKHFQQKLAEYQSVIADKQLMLSTKLTNAIYTFYSDVSRLLI